MCAAAELGLSEIPKLFADDQVLPDNPKGAARAASAWKGGDLVVSPATESAFYWVTSGETMTEYSMPHNIVKCARLLGLRAEIHMVPGLATTLLQKVYPRTVELCKGAGIPIHRFPVEGLTGYQRELVVVTTWGVGLHYVMHRPDGSYMDPGDGTDQPDFSTLNTWAKTYRETGISIVLTDEEVRETDMNLLFNG